MFPAQLQPPGLRKTSYSRAELLQCGRGQLFGPGNAGHIVAELDIMPDLWFFDRHLPDFKPP